ncbi:MAG: DUF4097 family beta strand repeat-containing protein [Planctomycetota bacterium]|jgi:hypothetical protein
MRIRTLALILGAVAWLGGCGTGGFLRHPFDPSAWGDHFQEDDPLILNVTGPVAIDVESFGGDVIITANEKLTEATVTVRREARHGSSRRKEAKASLAEIGYSAVVVPGESGPVLEVRTWTGHPEPYFQRAHLEINVPAATGVTVRSRDGLVAAVDIEGAVDIECAAGDVRVMTNRPMWQAVTVINDQGDIDYRVRGESTGLLDCETQDGELLYRARQGRFIVSEVTPTMLRATLNEGENPIRLRTTGGNIRVAVVHNPTEVGEKIVDP